MKLSLQGRRLVGMILILAMVMLSGCENTSGTQKTDYADAGTKVYMTIEENDVTMETLMLYSMLYIFNNDIVASDLTDTGLSDFKAKIVEQVKVEYVEYQLAVVMDDLILGESDYASVDSQTASFMNYFGEDFMEKYGVTRDEVYNMFERQAYISQLQSKSLSDLQEDYLAQYQEDYADKDFFSAYYVLFPSVEYDEDNQPVADDDGNAISLNEAQMAEQYERAVELREKALEYQAQGTVSGNLELLAEEYGVDFLSDTQRSYHGAFTASLNEVIDSLADGEISDVIETAGGYMIVRMDNTNDTEYKEYALESVAGQSAQALYPTLQSNWLSASGVESLEGDSEVLDAIDYKALCTEMNQKGFSISGGTTSE